MVMQGSGFESLPSFLYRTPMVVIRSLNFQMTNVVSTRNIERQNIVKATFNAAKVIVQFRADIFDKLFELLLLNAKG